MTGFVVVENCDNPKSFQGTQFSCRSLQSVNDSRCPSASPWRRSFNPLDSFRTESRRASCQHKGDGSVESTPTAGTQLTDLDPEISPKQHKKDSFLVEECSVATPDCDSWHGFVTIGRDLAGPCSPASPDSLVARKLRYVDVSSKTSPRPKKKKSGKKVKKNQSRRSSRNSPTAVVPWGDLAIIHDFHRGMEELGSPGHTPKKAQRKKLRLNSGLDCDGYKDSSDGIVGLWDELVEAPPLEDSLPFDTLMLNGGPHNSELDSLLQAAKPSITQTLPQVLPFWTEGNDSFLDRFKTLYDSSENDNSDLIRDLTRSPDDDENPLSASAPSEHEDVASDDLLEKPSQGRLIRFADEQGLPIEKVYEMGDDSHYGTMGKIIVLFVDPLVKKFEFLQGEYSKQAGTTVADLLKQLPSFAVSEWFTKMEYGSLYGTHDGPRELNAMDRLDQLDLNKREITVAVGKGVSGVELVNDAAPILRNDEIIRAVKKAIRVGRGIKYIKSQVEMEAENPTELPLSEIDLNHNDIILPENLGLENRDLKDYQRTPRKGRFYPPPFIDLYDSNDHVPLFDDDSVFSDQREVPLYYEADHNPHRVIKFLHASLLATIGIAYSLTTK